MSTASIEIGSALLPPTPETLSKLTMLRELLVQKDDQARKKITERFKKYRADPVKFVNVALREHVWSKQRQIMESVRDNRRTAVPSCHDSGKSFVAARVAAHFLACHPPGEAFVVTSAPTHNQVKNILWREIGRAHAKGKLPGRLNQIEWYMDLGDGREEIVAFGRKPADYDPTAFQGIHQLYVLVILDEACGIPLTLWTASETLITNENCRILAIGNPDDPSSHFATICKPGSGWNVIHISAFDTPNFTGEEIPEAIRPLLLSKVWVEEKLRDWGETSPLYVSKVTGKFPESSDDGLLLMSDLVAATTRELKAEGANELGVDVARFGTDLTVLYHRLGPVFRCHKRFNNRDTMFTVGEVVHACHTLGCRRAKIDDTGLGGGVTDRLREIVWEAKELKSTLKPDQLVTHERWQAIGHMAEVEIVAINVGEAPITVESDEKFYNLRAELNWGLRMRFREGNISLPAANADDIRVRDQLLGQASQIKYERTSDGRLKIEAKDKMKERLGGRSPDDWDALVLAAAEPRLVGVGFLNFYAEQVKASQGTKETVQ